MRKITILAALVAGVSAMPANASVKILGVNVAKNDICPNASTNKCLSKPNGATGYYLTEDRDLSLDANKQPNLDLILGKIFTQSVRLDGNFCGKEGTDALRKYAAANGVAFSEEVHANPVHFTVKATKLLDAKGGVDAKAIARAAGIPDASLDKVAAAVEAAYNSSKSKSVDVTGTYRYIRINPNLTQLLEANTVPDTLQPCANWLKANPTETLIVSVTGYQLTKASISSEMKSKFSEKFEAKVSGEASGTQIAAVEQSFSSAVEKTSELSFEPFFQLLTVGRYPE